MRGMVYGIQSRRGHRCGGMQANHQYALIFLSGDPQGMEPVFRIRINFLRIRILDFSLSPDPGREKKFRGKNKILGENFVFNPKSTVGILFLFSTNQVGRYFIKQNFNFLSFLKIS